MDITVAVSGKGQSYKSNLKIDPADILENTLRNRTHFWKTFMKRGQNKCLVVVSNKNEEDTYVAPNYFDQSFSQIGVSQGAQIQLVEMKNIPSGQDSEDFDEEGEAEMEEGEDEVENNGGAEDEENGQANANQEGSHDANEDDDKKASEVLFDEQAAGDKQQ